MAATFGPGVIIAIHGVSVVLFNRRCALLRWLQQLWNYTMSNLEIIYQSVEALTPNPRNARKHSKKQIKQLAAFLKNVGLINPLIVDRNNVILAGHARLSAAKQLGLSEVPTICCGDLSPEQVRAYMIADNRLAELASWDRETLAVEFADLLEVEIDFDITLTGFEMPQIDLILGEQATQDSKVDEVPEVRKEEPATTRLGDVFAIGPHRLVCGDALRHETYDTLLEGQKAQTIFADLPYNLKIHGQISGKGKVKHKEFAMASGEMSESEFKTFLVTAFSHLANYSIDGSLHYHCMDWRHSWELLEAGREVYSELKNLCVWAKNNGGMGSLYRSQHELVFVFKSGSAAHINNVELGKHGRNRTNLWSYPGQNSFGKTRDADLAAHPTVKPVRMVADAILDCSARKDLVLDAFAGSGTTLIAAHATGRHGRAIEIDPHYCDVIVARMRKVAGLETTHVGTGLSFAELRDARQKEAAQ